MSSEILRTPITNLSHRTQNVERDFTCGKGKTQAVYAENIATFHHRLCMHFVSVASPTTPVAVVSRKRAALEEHVLNMPKVARSQVDAVRRAQALI